MYFYMYITNFYILCIHIYSAFYYIFILLMIFCFLFYLLINKFLSFYVLLVWIFYFFYILVFNLQPVNGTWFTSVFNCIHSFILLSFSVSQQFIFTIISFPHYLEITYNKLFLNLSFPFPFSCFVLFFFTQNYLFFSLSNYYSKCYYFII